MPLPLLSTLTSFPLITLALFFIFLYTLYGALYRLYLSPVAKFPGPRFAALTFWNEFYYDVVQGGGIRGRFGSIMRNMNYVNKLCNRLAEHRAAGKYVVMTHAYACLTGDVISEYSFPKGYGFLDRSEFSSEQYDAWITLSEMSHLLKQFGWLFPMLHAMPLWLTRRMSPETYLVVREQDVLLKQCIEMAEQRKAVGNKEKEYREETAGRPSMIEAFLDSKLPEAEKAPERIMGEIVSAMFAGTLTSSHALKIATYHILANPTIYERIMTMLESGIPDPDNPPNLRELEQMDYLMATLYETLRLFHGVSQRLQRIFPDRCLQYKEWTIPPGTPMSMTSVHVHDNPTIFPEPYEFKPDRWLPLDTNGKRLQKYLVAFGKGSRSCVGMELGKAEILTTLASVFRKFGREMRLVDCVRERDVDIVGDKFDALASKECSGLIVAFGPKDG